MIEGDYVELDVVKGFKLVVKNICLYVIWYYMVNIFDFVVEYIYIGVDNLYYYVCMVGKFLFKCYFEYFSFQIYVKFFCFGVFDGLCIYIDEFEEVIVCIMLGILIVVVVMDSMDWFDFGFFVVVVQIIKLNCVFVMGGCVMF